LVFGGSKNSNRTDHIAEKVFLRKLDFFIFVSRSLPGWPAAAGLMPLLFAAHSPPSPL
jgi:hypothetical protein